MGKRSGGRWLELVMIIDATLVLSGATITAFVGYTGLAHRMTLDRCLPQVFLQTNKWRGTRHNIILGFWLLTSLLVLFTQGTVFLPVSVSGSDFVSMSTYSTCLSLTLVVSR